MIIRIKHQWCGFLSGSEFCCDPDAQCGDCDEYILDEEQASYFEKLAARSSGGHGAYLRRCAETVRRALS